MANKINIGQSVGDMTINPSGSPDRTSKLMSPNAKEDPETVSGDNPQVQWLGKGKMPKGPLGPQGREF